jgi:hypothetical protein
VTWDGGGNVAVMLGVAAALHTALGLYLPVRQRVLDAATAAWDEELPRRRGRLGRRGPADRDLGGRLRPAGGGFAAATDVRGHGGRSACGPGRAAVELELMRQS